MAIRFPTKINVFNEKDLFTHLAEDSVYVADNFLTQVECAALRQELQGLQSRQQLNAARIGRAKGTLHAEAIRNDLTLWLPTPETPLGNQVLARIESYKVLLNQELMLGLWDFEGHYALYPPGGHYLRHLDRFGSDQRRTVSTILYLNPPDWQEEQDGGALQLYTSLDTPIHLPEAQVSPVGGRIVWFLSAEIPHAVAPARRERMSITGWFRTR